MKRFIRKCTKCPYYFIMSVFLPNEINFNSLTYAPPVHEKGYSKSLLAYTLPSTENGKVLNNILIQSVPVFVNSVDTTNIRINLPKEKMSENLYNTLKKLEHHAIEQVSSHSQEWFGKIISNDRVKKMFKSCIEHPDTLNDNLILKTKKHEHFQVYNERKEIVTEESLQPGTRIVCLFALQGILFGKNAAKLNLSTIQIRISPPAPKLPKDCQISDEDDPSDDEKTNPANVDSDIEDDDDAAFRTENVKKEKDETFVVLPTNEEEESIPEKAEQEEDEEKTEEKLLRDKLGIAISKNDYKEIAELSNELLRIQEQTKSDAKKNNSN